MLKIGDKVWIKRHHACYKMTGRITDKIDAQRIAAVQLNQEPEKGSVCNSILLSQRNTFRDCRVIVISIDRLLVPLPSFLTYVLLFNAYEITAIHPVQPVQRVQSSPVQIRTGLDFFRAKSTAPAKTKKERSPMNPWYRRTFQRLRQAARSS